MRKQYKISARYYLNKALRCYEDNKEQYWAVYIQLIFHRKTSKIKSKIGYMTDTEFEKFQQGNTTAKAWTGGQTIGKNGNLIAAIEKVNTHNELEDIKNTILLLEDWTNTEYDITAPRFDRDIKFFSYPTRYIMLEYGRFITLLKSGYETNNQTSTLKYDFLHILTSCELSLERIIEVFDKLGIKLSDIIPDSVFRPWLFSYNMKNPDKPFIQWLMTDYPQKYKGNDIVNDIIEQIKEEATQSGYLIE